MTFSPSWYTRDVEKETDPTLFDRMSADKFTNIVNKAALNNHDLQANALRTADSYSFQVVHPELLRSDKNTKLINHWLSTHGISQPTYPDFQAAYDDLTAEGLLSIDKSIQAPRTFVGVLSKQTYGDVDSLILNEQQAAISQFPSESADEKAFNKLPADQQLAMLREAERLEQSKLRRPEQQKNADAWLTLHPEYFDNTRNGKLMKVQLRSNGVVEGNETIQDFEVASQQLRASGLLTLNQTSLNKQHAEELRQRASEAVETPGSVFDTDTSEEDMYALSMDELRARSNKVLSGKG